jgi:hypothetical protein
MTTKAKSKAASFGQAGGKATLKKYGPDHYAKLAKKMHAKRRKAARLAEKVA